MWPPRSTAFLAFQDETTLFVSSDVQQTPAERLQTLMARLKDLREKAAVDPAKIRSRFMQLMNQEAPDGSTIVELSGQLWAKAEQEVAKESSNGVTAAQVDSVDVAIDVILRDALDEASQQLDDLEAQMATAE